jgi:hypothetical protein
MSLIGSGSYLSVGGLIFVSPVELLLLGLDFGAVVVAPPPPVPEGALVELL